MSIFMCAICRLEGSKVQIREHIKTHTNAEIQDSWLNSLISKNKKGSERVSKDLRLSEDWLDTTLTKQQNQIERIRKIITKMEIETEETMSYIFNEENKLKYWTSNTEDTVLRFIQFLSPNEKRENQLRNRWKEYKKEINKVIK